MQLSDGGPEADESIDWQALARFWNTGRVYGVTTATQWSKALIGYGKSPDTPVALVRRCTWPDQETIVCRLDNVANELTPSSRLRPPVIAIIGPVAALGEPY